ncbi:cation:proton antiporter [Aeromonas australiensis]|uniref:cation:proton antiporter n=1 Tax=Aeromonas australiensis TaxID=1114880 RepID=UPI001F3CE5EE|nr:cation:proton antiporter [Aeromonas australiensis]MCF3098748.1 cation:proton antiporter [Aeromonas australiensis]
MDKVYEISILISYLLLLISIVMSLLRLLIGPTLADRVVALDLLAFLTIGVLAVYTLDSGHESLLDVAITLALVAFLGTIAFAKFISRQDTSSNEDRES